MLLYERTERKKLINLTCTFALFEHCHNSKPFFELSRSYRIPDSRKIPQPLDRAISSEHSVEYYSEFFFAFAAVELNEQKHC